MNYTIMALLGAKDIGLRSTMARASGDVQRFSKQTAAAGKSASRFGSVLKAGFLAAGAAMVVFFGQAISKAVAFETSMRNVNSIAGESERGFRQMSDAVLQLSTRVPQSATVLADGLYDIASSGFEGAGALEVLEQSAIAATAGMTTTDVAARAIAASINAYGLSAADAADVSDILFQTVNLGVVTFEQLANGLGNVVGSAAAAGVELDEVGAAIAAMTLSGLGAEESVTSLNRLMEKIIKPSEALGNTLQNLGYESGKAALDALGLHGTMELLRLSTGGNVTELLKLFPEIRAARGAFALMAADGQNYARTFAGISDETARAGAAQRAYEEQSKALSVQWDLFVSSFNAFSIRVGTAFIPALKSGLAALTDFGKATAGVLGQLGTAAAPMVRSLAQAFQEVGRVGAEVYATLQPLVRMLGVAFAAVAITGLRALAEAFAAVAGTLADHPALIRAVALLLGGMLLTNLLSSAAAATKFAVQFRALLVMETLGPILTGLVSRLRAFGLGLQALFAGNTVGSTVALGAAFQGLGSAIAAIAAPVGIAAILGSLVALQTALSNAKRQAQEMRAEIEADIDFTSSESIVRGMRLAGEAFDEASAKVEEYSGVLGFLKSTYEVLNPAAANTFYDSAAAASEASDAYNDLLDANSNLATGLVQLQDQLGITEPQAASLLEALDFDPATFGGNFVQLGEDAREMAAQMAGGAPAAETLGTAMADAGDLAMSAADRVDAFTGSLDALIGTMLGTQDAAIAYQQAIDDLSESFSENGTTLDINTEAGRDHASAINEAASAAVEHAAAIVESTGSMQDGANTLSLYREQLLGQLEGYGLSRAAAEEYLETIGLTPDNLTTLIELAGVGEATHAMGQVFDAVTQLDLTVAEPRVELDDLPFLDRADAVGEFLVQIGQQAPEARVLLDDSQFRPTAQQVQTWADTWEDSSPQAQALLDIIPALGRFGSLSEAAASWDSTNTSASAGVDDLASAGYDRFQFQAGRWGGTSTSATAGVRDNATGRFRYLGGVADQYDRRRPTATANLNDNASGPLSSINRTLNGIDGRTVTATATIQYRGRTAPREFGMRWGGVVKAQSGFHWPDAGIATDPTVFWGERETGGEAYIPRRGDRDRSLDILAQAAQWYGMAVVDKDAIAARTGYILGGLGASGAPSFGHDLQGAIGDVADEIERSTRLQIDADTVHFHWLANQFDREIENLSSHQKERHTDLRQNLWILLRGKVIPDTFNATRYAQGLPQFANGGMVPGRIGQAVPIVAHGGERVLTAAENRRLSQPAVVNYQLGGHTVVVELKGDVVDAVRVDKRIASAITFALDEDRRNLLRQLKVRR